MSFGTCAHANYTSRSEAIARCLSELHIVEFSEHLPQVDRFGVTFQPGLTLLECPGDVSAVKEEGNVDRMKRGEVAWKPLSAFEDLQRFVGEIDKEGVIVLPVGPDRFAVVSQRQESQLLLRLVELRRHPDVRRWGR